MLYKQIFSVECLEEGFDPNTINILPAIVQSGKGLGDRVDGW